MQKTILLAGPAGPLEALLTEPTASEPVAVAIICHPHPLQEGTMYNKVVTTLMKAADACCAVTLRFNYRGVGQSAGQFDDAVGECDDLRAVIAFAQQHYPNLPIWLAGFSFGAYIAARVAHDDGVAQRLITIAPAIEHYQFTQLTKMNVPWLLVQGDQDEVVNFAAVAAFAQYPPAPLDFQVMRGTGHFFHGRLIELREIVLNWLSGVFYATGY